jgi:hypothetical protein
MWPVFRTSRNVRSLNHAYLLMDYITILLSEELRRF